MPRALKRRGRPRQLADANYGGLYNKRRCSIACCGTPTGCYGRLTSSSVITARLTLDMSEAVTRRKPFTECGALKRDCWRQESIHCSFNSSCSKHSLPQTSHVHLSWTFIISRDESRLLQALMKLRNYKSLATQLLPYTNAQQLRTRKWDFCDV